MLIHVHIHIHNPNNLSDPALLSLRERIDKTADSGTTIRYLHDQCAIYGRKKTRFLVH